MVAQDGEWGDGGEDDEVRSKVSLRCRAPLERGSGSHGRDLVYCLCPERVDMAVELLECVLLECRFWLIQQREQSCSHSTWLVPVLLSCDAVRAHLVQIVPWRGEAG